MTDCNKYYIKGVFITLSDGLLIFHDVSEANWKEIYQPDLLELSEAHFENPNMQQLFLTGLIENLRDMDPNKENYKMRYCLVLAQNTENTDLAARITNPRLKYIEYYKIKILDENSKLYQFCIKNKA
jgi:hypothetical protein